MFNFAAPTCTRSTCSLGLALSTLLLGPAPAAAQDMQTRAASLAAASLAAGTAGAVPTASIAMHYRISDRHVLFANAAQAGGLGANPATNDISTKLGVEWKPSRSTLGFEHGAIGVQLDSGFRLSLKSRRGGPVLYLRNSF